MSSFDKWQGLLLEPDKIFEMTAPHRENTIEAVNDGTIRICLLMTSLLFWSQTMQIIIIARLEKLTKIIPLLYIIILVRSYITGITRLVYNLCNYEHVS